MRYVICITSILLLISGCDPTKIGGPCEYNSIPGIATIKSVTSKEKQSQYYEDVVIIIFDFVPNNPSYINDYKIPHWPNTNRKFITVPPRAWATANGIVVGSAHRCARDEITKGTCTPVMFHFTDIDEFSWVDSYRKKP